MKLVRNSANMNSMYMVFKLLLRMDSPHSCRMIWRIIKMDVVTQLMNIGVISCPPSSKNMIGKRQRPKSRVLQDWEEHLNLTAMNPLGFREITRLVLVYFLTKNSNSKICPSITVHSNIAYFARRQECLIKSICHITLTTVLVKRSDQNSLNNGVVGALGSRDDAKKQYKKLKINGRNSWILPGRKKMFCSISKKSGSCRVLKNIKKIRAKDSKKCSNSSSDSFRD